MMRQAQRFCIFHPRTITASSKVEENLYLHDIPEISLYLSTYEYP